MAQIQFASGTQSARNTPRAWPRQRVQIRKNWTDSWNTQFERLDTRFLFCRSCTLSAAPTVPKAHFRYVSGLVKRESDAEFFEDEPIDLRNWFVRVQYVPEVTGIGASANNQPGVKISRSPQTIFLGRFANQQTEWLGDETTQNVAPCDQDYVAEGIEREFMTTPIVGSYFRNDDNTTGQIAHTLTFNQRFSRGPTVLGNRSANKVTIGTHPQAYVFGSDANLWSAYDILEYLLAFFSPKDIKITVGGQASAILKSLTIPRVAVEGLTLFQAIEQIVHRRRGVNWCLRPKSDNSSDLMLHVYSVFDEEVSIGTEKIPKNGEPKTLAVDGRIEPSNLRVAEDTASLVGKIIVEGERIVTCFSVSVKDGTLEKAWSTAQESAYKTGAGKTADDGPGGAEANDQARHSQDLAHVYTTFRIPKAFQWKAGDGIGGDARLICNPGVKDDGSLDDGTAAPARTWGHTLQRSLPIRKPKGATDYLPEYEEPFVLCENDGTYVFLHNHGLESKHLVHLRMLDNDFGFQLMCSPNHVMAKGVVLGNPSNFNAAAHGFDYSKIIATVAVRTDAVLRVTETIAGRDETRQVRIKVPDAEMWYILPKTVTGIGPDGKLLRRSGKLKSDPPDFEKDLLVRDDSQRLRRMAALAKAWYTKERAALSVTMQDFLVGYPVGAYLQSASDSKLSFEVNSVITQVTFDFQNATTQITTDFAELEFMDKDELPEIR